VNTEKTKCMALSRRQIAEQNHDIEIAALSRLISHSYTLLNINFGEKLFQINLSELSEIYTYYIYTYIVRGHSD
jgi:hypothetical protein